MVNEVYEPDEREDEILSLLKEGCGNGDPWGRANPLYFRENSTLDKGQVEYALTNLRNAGWIRRVNAGLYELVEDPREADRGDSN